MEENLVKNKINNKKVPLEWPFEFDGKQIDHVVISRLKSKHLEMIPASMMSGKGKNVNPKDALPLIAAICGLSPEAAGEIDFEDLVIIVEVLGDFLEGATSPTTGSK